LYTIVGVPHAPDPRLEIPDPTSLEALLRSSRPPLDGVIYVIGMVGWGLWGWLVFSLVLQLITAGAERLAAGTTAVRRLRTLADVLCVPLVRKAVHASLAGGIVVRVAVAGMPTAVAAAPQNHAVVVMVGRAYAGAPASPRSDIWAAEEPTDNIPVGSVVYTVQPGDNLAKIAERFYANGDKWQVLYQANQGRRMQDGATFDRAGVIQPGWRLIVPEPTEAINTDVDGRRWYTVRQGDSLAGISARLLGDEQRWPELFAVNEGVRLDERRPSRPTVDLARFAPATAVARRRLRTGAGCRG
jgi:LysM repeat protein